MSLLQKISISAVITAFAFGSLPTSANEACINALHAWTRQEDREKIKILETSVYAPVVSKFKGRNLSREQSEKLWRMTRKHFMRLTDETPSGVEAERRMKILTNRDRDAYTWGGYDESADPAAPFVIRESDRRPEGMPTGSYSVSSGKYGFIYPTTNDMLRNEKPIRFAIEFQQVARDGSTVVQHGEQYASGDSSWGWDGRFEIQPDGKGGTEIVITQGAMELPVNLEGAKPGSPLAPRVDRDNTLRARHLFELREWVPARKGQRAKLIVRDRGTIMDFNPKDERRWIQTDGQGKLLHAHGYGENFVPDEVDHRKIWTDEEGYPWRVFDMVTKEIEIERVINGKVIKVFIPAETRAVAAAMDRKNPSKMAAEKDFVYLTSNYNREQKPYPAVIRDLYDTTGKAVEQRTVLENKKVVVSDKVRPNAPALLNEGLNLYEEPVKVGNKTYYIATNSAGEYTSGGLPVKNQRLYGVYLWYREVRHGKIGPYTPVLDDTGLDLKDMFDEITQMYGGSWGIGRAQLIKAQNGTMWAKAHMVDIDLLPEDQTRFPRSGYPARADIFASAYRRHQVLIPVEVVEQNGLPMLKVTDPVIQQDLLEWRKRQASLLPRNHTN